MKRLALVGALVASAVAMMLGPAGDAGAVGKQVMVRLTAAPEIPSGAQRIGAVSPAATETGAVVLKPRNEGALTSFIASLTTAGSSSFHHYLAPGQFESRFGPTQATIDSVKSQLAADGLDVTGVSSDGLLVEFKGTARHTESAFQTGLTRYKLANGTTGQATNSAVHLPSSIAGQVSSVIGLDSLVQPQALDVERGSLAKARAHTAAKTAQFSHPAGSPDACSDASAAAAEFGGLTDDQIANSYGAFGLYQQGDFGTGQHIAIYELEPFLPSDIKTFDTCYFGTSMANQMASRLHVIPVDGGQPTGPGSGEAILDVEDVSAVAPGATIDVYEAPNNVFDNSDFGPLDAYAAIVNNDQDQVVSTSWGLCEQAVQQGEPGIQEAENFLFQQAAAQGQSIFSAAGDTGDDDCNEDRDNVPPAGQNVLSVDDPSSQPYVVAAGGTTITDATEPPTEQVWNDGGAYGGGGGGISQSWAMPSWQLNSKVPGIAAALPGGADYTNANDVETKNGFPTGFCQSTIAGATSATPCRTLPDVSAQADEFTGAITIFSEEFEGPGTPDGWITIGGTSSAAPLWAAMLADVNASATCQASTATASGVGFVNPLLYAVASSPAAYKASFTDITAGNNDIYGLDNGLVFPATAGYDLASGLGSPQLTNSGGTAGLAYYLCSYATQASRPGVSDIRPAQVSTSGGTITITGSGFESGGSSQVAGIQVGSTELTSGQFSVNSASTITAKLPAAIDTLPPGSAAPQDGAGPADIIVSLKNGQSTEPGPASTIEYVNENNSGQGVPSITGLSPTGGPEVSPTPVTILGSDFSGATKVTFGGIAAKSFTVISPSEISATPPAYSSSTKCAPSPKGESATTDLCQSQVQVTNAHGSSAEGTILTPLEGTLPALNAQGVFDLPPGCNCEQEPAPTEFDYTPTPTVTSISTSPANPSSLASENGGTLITVKGTGFNLLTLDWADIGDPTQAASQDFDETFISGTEIQIEVPPTASLTTDSTTLPFSVKTLGGSSNALPITYAGVPIVSGVDNAQTGSHGAADTGGTPISITGQGFDDAIAPIEFVDSISPYSIGTQYTFTVNSDTSISTETVGQNPALVDTEVCSVTACSTPSAADQLILYPPGNPRVNSVSPTSGPAAGGTPVVIRGQNLGCVTRVFFGNVKALSASNQQAILDCGSTSTVDATAPAGTAGESVKVRVTTVESDLTGSGSSTSTATFKYTSAASPPRRSAARSPERSPGRRAGGSRG